MQSWDCRVRCVLHSRISCCFARYCARDVSAPFHHASQVLQRLQSLMECRREHGDVDVPTAAQGQIRGGDV